MVSGLVLRKLNNETERDTMDWPQIAQYLFYAFGALIATSAINILKDLKRSIEELNVNMAVVIKESQWHEKWLIKHDEELRALREVK